MSGTFDQGARGDNSFFDGRTVLITGGTGSFGRAFTRHLLAHARPAAVRIFSRDELKQHEMDREFGDERLRFLLGDVREQDRLRRAMRGVDTVIHAAALKQVPACEYNPFEAVKTNILGAQNVIETAIDCGVERVLAISTDKAVIPVNLYGATKLCAEKIFIHGNSYAGPDGPRFSCVRYGNVIGSRGSVVPLFREQREHGAVTLTDERMTRFWITLEGAALFVARALQRMRGQEIFVPRVPSMKVADMAAVVAPGCKSVSTGMRPGEKLHEDLITAEEATRCLLFDGMFVILPSLSWARANGYPAGATPEAGFVYRSDTNTRWLSHEELREILRSSLHLEV